MIPAGYCALLQPGNDQGTNKETTQESAKGGGKYGANNCRSLPQTCRFPESLDHPGSDELLQCPFANSNARKRAKTAKGQNQRRMARVLTNMAAAQFPWECKPQQLEVLQEEMAMLAERNVVLGTGVTSLESADRELCAEIDTAPQALQW
ncbi:hypothetical protein HOY80DRAFT_1004942 [Tuber brumale]|nr:hypothetical protein HOY80DRAFT_1004942 [Tuber brumale]